MKNTDLIAILTIVVVAGVLIWHFVSQKKK
jgi:hypothetical protein